MYYIVQYYQKTLLSNRQCCNLSFSQSNVMVYVLNSDNCCYFLSSFILLDDVIFICLFHFVNNGI